MNVDVLGNNTNDMYLSTLNPLLVDEMEEVNSMIEEEVFEVKDVGVYIDSKEGYVVKFDSAASRCMSGIKGRVLEVLKKRVPDVRITGFNGSHSTVDKLGLNEDGKLEYYVSSMPQDLVLLCANDYAQEGAAILFKDDGIVIKMTDDEILELKHNLSQYPVLKKLVVRNRTYEVAQSPTTAKTKDYSYYTKHAEDNVMLSYTEDIDMQIEKNDAFLVTEEGFSGRANRFFNTKVHVSNGTDRVLSMLLMGFSLQDLKHIVKSDSVSGIPPDLTSKTLNVFEHRYGRTPDAVTLAIPLNRMNRTGLMSKAAPLEQVGQRVECDIGEPDQNERRQGKEKRATKVKAFGGALAFAVAVDCFSGFIMTRLLRTLAHTLVFIKYFIEEFEQNEIQVKLFASDSGIVSQSKFQVMTSDTEQFLRSKKIKTERAEPYNHQIGTPTVEQTIRRLKELINVAISFILRNPVFPLLGFTELQIKQLWGELLMWATVMINLKPCPHDKTKTRYEVFYKKKPNIQNIRILPIFSVVLVPRMVHNPDDGTYKMMNKIALYVGPALKTPGAIRAAVLSKEKKLVNVIVTSKFTPATDGGGLNIYDNVNRGLLTMMYPPNQPIVDEEPEEIVQEDNPPTSASEAESKENGAQVSPPSSNLVEQEVKVVQKILDIPAAEGPPTDTVNSRSISNKSSSAQVITTLVDPDEYIENEENDTEDHYTKDPSMDESYPQHKEEEEATNSEESSGENEEEEMINNSDHEEETKMKIKRLNNKKMHAQTKRKAKKTNMKKKSKNSSQYTSTDTNNNNKKKKINSNKQDIAKDMDKQNDNPYKKLYVNSSKRRHNSTSLMTVEEFAHYADWIEFGMDSWYWSFANNCFYRIAPDELRCKLEASTSDSAPLWSSDITMEEGYKAVKENVPKSFPAALQDPRWGAPARKELNTLFETKAIVEVDPNIAKRVLKSNGADLVILFPVYETKEKEGQQVDKVRLVGDGRTHYSAVHTYAATPSREELLVLLHIIAMLGWTYYHVDEIRAFLSARYNGGKRRVFTRFLGDNKFYEVLGALYGLKSSPRDYQQQVIDRLTSMGFKRLSLCSCIFVCREENNVVLIYDYVDDFIITGNNSTAVQDKINLLRDKASTTEPIFNAEKVLGMEIKRDITKHIMLITMTKKIEEVCEKFQVDHTKIRHTPMATRSYIVKESEFEKLPEEETRFLNAKEKTDYLALVGSLLWISGIRMDILFATMYLSWATKTPRVHHMVTGKGVLAYLLHTKNLPLVLGGKCETESAVDIIGYSDASLGTGTKGRSIKAHMFKLGTESGAITAKCGNSTSVYTSSFEAELDGVVTGMKTAARLMNILDEIGVVNYGRVSTLYNDNLAMIKFIQGEGLAKGIRHVELRMFYAREKYLEGNILVKYMKSENLPADQMTKLGSKHSFLQFRKLILGLGLLTEEQLQHCIGFETSMSDDGDVINNGEEVIALFVFSEEIDYGSRQN